MCGLIRGSAGWRPRSTPQTSHRNRAKALRSAMAPRLGPLLRLCKMAIARLSVNLDKSRGQRHCTSPLLCIDPPTGIAPCSVELYEAVVAVNDVKRPSQFGQERDCWSPFRSERPARPAGQEVDCRL